MAVKKVGKKPLKPKGAMSGGAAGAAAGKSAKGTSTRQKIQSHKDDIAALMKEMKR